MCHDLLTRVHHCMHLLFLYLEEGGSLGRCSCKTELQFAKHILQQENQLSRTEHNLLYCLTRAIKRCRRNIKSLLAVIRIKTKASCSFSYLGVELRVQQWAGNQITLQHTEHLDVQLSEKLSVGHETDALPDLLFFLLLWLLLLAQAKTCF